MSKKVLTVTLNPSIDKTISVEKMNFYGLNRVVVSRIDPGGKGINVARVLKNFNVEVIATGLIAGNQGKILLNYLDHAGIPNDFLEIDGETRTNIKILDVSNKRTTEINEKGFFVSEENLNRFRDKYKELIEQVEFVVLSGSIPPGVPQEIYKECVQVARNRGKKVILDADGQAFREGLQAVPFAVKPNLHELELAVGKKLSGCDAIVNATKSLLGKGIEVIITSMGSDGAIVVGCNEIYKADTWNIEVNGATGAGDSMVAALAYAILRNNSLAEISRITTAAGTVTASKEGTQICALEEVERSMHLVNIFKIS